MSRSEAEALLTESGVTPCVRLYLRADGTFVTGTCTTLKRRDARVSRCAQTLIGAALTLALSACTGKPAPDLVAAAGNGVATVPVEKSDEAPSVIEQHHVLPSGIVARQPSATPPPPLRGPMGLPARGNVF